jgi:hypothetical protein
MLCHTTEREGKFMRKRRLTTSSSTEYEERKKRLIRKRGWFVPTLHEKYLGKKIDGGEIIGDG